MLNRCRTFCASIVVGFLLFASSPLQAGNYNIIELGVPLVGYDKTASVDMNNSGQILGWSSGMSGLGLPIVSFVLTPEDGVWFRDEDADGVNDLMVVLELPGSSAIVRAINDSGQITGTIRWPDFSRNGFLWDKGVVTTLGHLGVDPVDGTSSFAFGINNLGQIVGYSILDGRTVGFVWKDGAMLALGELIDLTGGSDVSSINDLGEIAGRQHVSGEWKPILWRNGIPIDLGSLGGNRAEARGINNLSQVVGWSRFTGGASTESKAFLWTDGVMKDLDAVSRPRHSWAEDVNNKGEVVGSQGGANTFLWLPKPAYGLNPGLHFAPFLLPPSSGWVLNSMEAINDDGNILGWGTFEGNRRGFIMIPPPTNDLIVNSVGDAPDNDPTDTICNTGNTVDGGQPECTMRAAIEEANARAGLDTILFDIPGSGVPVIHPGTGLPEITDPVIINGSTQPIANKVEINGSMALSANGLQISAGNSEIRHLLINNFAGNGLVLLTGDSNLIGNLSIGVGPDGIENRGNDGHGIYILNSSNNQIGNPVLSRRNTIAHNGQIGVFVEGGTGNIIRNNRLFANAGLGIDLAPRGVTPNDSGDGDAGANGLQNFPVIDSVDVDLVTTIWGTISSAGGQSYDIDLYLNDSCDASGYGEGKTLIQSAPIFVDADGTTPFEIQAVVTPASGQRITATATDRDGNTSEFSACWPKKVIEVVDVDSASAGTKMFVLFKVADDAPAYTKKLIDTVMTDADGRIDLAFYYGGGQLGSGDMFTVERLLHMEATAKHPTVLATAYSVYLDNVKFDTLGHILFDRLDGDSLQQVVLDHTTIKFNVVVSIEWDADLAYLNSTEQGFQYMSNYFYDVSDGQMCFDTIVIFDNKENWDFCDFQINASNLVHPHVKTIGGFYRPGLAGSDPIEMPRKWFGNVDASRNGSAAENPLDMSDPDENRTRLHEFGHFALKFDDEYMIFKDPDVRCADHTPDTGPGAVPYGVMDDQYVANGEYTSELSTRSSYSDPDCQNNNHWRLWGRSCWELTDTLWNKTYDGLEAPIFQPDERMLASGFDYLQGPNNNLTNLDYDAGASVVFPNVHTAPASVSLFVKFTTEAAGAGDSIPNATTTLRHPTADVPPVIRQGKSADNGTMWILGFRSGHHIYSAGFTHLLGSSGRTLGTERGWLYGIGVPGTSGVSRVNNSFTSTGLGDTMFIAMNQVAGNKSLIHQARLDSSQLVLRLDAPGIFASPPTVDHIAGGPLSTFSFTGDAEGYFATITDSLRAEGSFRIWAVDDSAATYFFETAYATGTIDSGTVSIIKGSNGAAEASIDNTGSAFEKAVMLSTQYPVLRTGLSPQSVQSGDAQSLSLFPQAPLLGDNEILIRYSDKELEVGAGVFGLESSLRIFHWDASLLAWALVGGTVDTNKNEVWAPILETGVYAAFTTDISTSIGDGGTIDPVLPRKFEVNQNYPNPFNASTVISFTLIESATVQVTIYNLLGQQVTRFEEGVKPAGRHSVTWHGKDAHGKPVTSGVYFFKVDAGDFSATRKLLLLK